MADKKNNRLATILLTLAIVQGPLLYYFTFGFFKLLGIVIFGSVGLILTIIAFFDLFRNRSNFATTRIICLIAAFIIGIGSISGDLMEYMDFHLRKWERNKIVEDLKKGNLKLNKQSGTYHSTTFIPISNNDNDIEINKDSCGIVSVEFYIDSGFIDHYTAFLYTNDPNEVSQLEHGTSDLYKAVKKLDQNWYRVAN